MSKIVNMSEGSIVSLVFCVNDAEIAKRTTMRKVLDSKYGTGIQCDLLTHNGQVLNCSKGLNRVVVSDNNTGNEYTFMDVKAVNVPNGNALLIYSEEDVEPTLQNVAPRFLCDYEAIFRVSRYPGSLKGSVKDISLSGIGCIIENGKVALNVGDKIYTSVVGYDRQANVLGTIMRMNQDEYDSGLTFVGIKMDDLNDLMRGIVDHLEHKYKTKE